MLYVLGILLTTFLVINIIIVPLKIIYFILLFIAIPLLPSCIATEALVNGANPIPDAQITNSSWFNDWHGPQHSRLHSTSGAGGWLCSTAEKDASTPSMYLQVCFNNNIIIMCYCTKCSR